MLNLSLANNSISVYQLAKMLTVPGTVLLTYLMYGKTYSMEVLGSLAVMTGGIGLTIGTIEGVNFWGTFFALSGVLVVCLSSVMTGELQKKHKVDPAILSYHIFPPQLGMLALIVLVMEPVFPGQAGSIWDYQWSFEAVFCILATCCFAMLLNLSGLWILNVFTSVTYSVVGYLKTGCVLAIGIIIFGESFTAWTFFGLCGVFGGAAWYNRAK